VAAVSRWQHVHSRQVDAVAFLQVEPCDAHQISCGRIIVELCHHSERLGAVQRIAAARSVPIDVGVLGVVSSARPITEWIQATSILITHIRCTACAFAFGLIGSEGSTGIGACVGCELLSPSICFQNIHLRAEGPAHSLCVAVVGAVLRTTDVAIHADKVQGSIEPTRHGRQLDVEGEFLILQQEHGVLIRSILLDQINARASHRRTSIFEGERILSSSAHTDQLLSAT